MAGETSIPGILTTYQRCTIDLPVLTQEGWSIVTSESQQEVYRRGDLIAGATREQGGINLVAFGVVQVLLLFPTEGAAHNLARIGPRRAFELFEVRCPIPAHTVAHCLSRRTAVHRVSWSTFVEAAHAEMTKNTVHHSRRCGSQGSRGVRNEKGG